MYYAYLRGEHQTKVTCIAEGKNYDEVKRFFDGLREEYLKTNEVWLEGYILSYREQNHVSPSIQFN